MIKRDEIIKFLELNGLQKTMYVDKNNNKNYQFKKPDVKDFSIDIDELGIFFIDWKKEKVFYIPENKLKIFTLAGFLLYFNLTDKIIFF
jgi:hypothetical protein